MADLFKQKWDAFCDNLKDVGSIIESESSLSEIDQAEGYRYLLRLMRLALEMNLEHSNLTSPSFYNLSHETAKIGADNPDNIYLNANIDGEQAYKIYGNTRGIDDSFLSYTGSAGPIGAGLSRILWSWLVDVIGFKRIALIVYSIVTL